MPENVDILLKRILKKIDNLSIENCDEWIHSSNGNNYGVRKTIIFN